MAHECPDCGQMCYCNGDIDDMLLNDDEDIDNCFHCLDSEDDFDDYEDWLEE
jgi:hypothetical protein